MRLNQKDKEKARDLLTIRLESLKEGEKLQLPKKLLEELLFDYYDVISNRKMGIRYKVLVFNSEELKKIDISEIDFTDSLYYERIYTLDHTEAERTDSNEEIKDIEIERKTLARKLRRLKEGKKIKLPKDLLEELLFNHYNVISDRKTIGRIKALVFNSEELNKLDTSEIDLTDYRYQPTSLRLFPTKTDIIDLKEYDDMIAQVSGIINNTPPTKSHTLERKS